MSNTIKLNRKETMSYIINSNDIEKKEFLQKNIDKNLIIKKFDSENKILSVSEYDKTKIFDFPFNIFEVSEDEQENDNLDKNINGEQNENSDIKNLSSSIFYKHIEKILLSIFLLIFTLILWKDLIFSNANHLTTWKTIEQNQIKKELNQFDKLTNKANKNRDYISQQLQKQKELREQKRELIELINQSIEKVRLTEQENHQIRNQLIELAQ